MNQRLLVLSAIFPTVLLGSAFSISREAIETEAGLDCKIFDYSSNALVNTLSGSNMLDKVLTAISIDPNTVPEIESSFVDDHFEFKFDALLNKNYNVGYLDGYYWVEAFEDENYTPKYLTVTDNEQEKVFNFDRYSKQFIALCDVSSLEGAEITYERKLYIPSYDASELITSTYKTAKEEADNIKAKNKYESELVSYGKYLENKAIYDEYLRKKAIYDLEYSNYEKYLADQVQYEIDLEKYNDYVKEMAEYSTKLEAYNSYLKELEVYFKNKETYEAALESFNKDMIVVNRQLQIMDILFTNFGDLDLSIDYFINSDSVDIVIREREKITAAGVEGVAVDLAKENTEIARSLLASYKQILGKDKEAKYKWYKNNYVNFRNSLGTLTKCLEYFYTLPIVRSQIEEKGKTDKYTLFISELIYFINNMYDDDIYSYQGNYLLDEYRQINGKSYYFYLSNKPLLDTSYVARPLTSGYPKLPGEIGDIEVELERPTEPIYVAEPIKPATVSKPTAPTVVNKPAEVLEPVDPKVTLRPEYADLAAAYSSGILPKRNNLVNDVQIKIQEKVTMNNVSSKDMLVVINTKNGITEEKGIFSEVCYFENADDIELMRNLPVNLGVKTTNENVLEQVFDDVTYSNLSSLNASVLLQKQHSKSEDANSFIVNWHHVINNSDHKDFKSLGVSFSNNGYENCLPSYDDMGNDPVHDDFYQGNVRKYTYKFVGYDFTSEVDSGKDNLSNLETCDEISEYLGNGNTIDINVVFEQVSCFNVTFENHAPVSIVKGNKVIAPEEIPTKTGTKTVRYEFIGWGVNGETTPVDFPYEINETTVFKALFKEVNSYEISFSVDGKIVSSQMVEEGSLPTSPTNVKKAKTSNSYFEFAGWDKEISEATEDKIYVAKFIEKEIVPSATISETANNLTINSNDSNNHVIFTNLFKLIKENEIESKNIIVNFKNAQLSFTTLQVNYLMAVNAQEIEFNFEKVGNEYKIKLNVYNEDKLIEGNAISSEIIIKNLPDANHCKVINGENQLVSNAINNSTLKFTMPANIECKIAKFFKITFDKTQGSVSFKLNGNQVKVADSFEFKEGEQISISALANEGIKINKLYSISPKGERKDINSGFEIHSDLKIYASVEKIIYKINLFVDGVLYKTISSTYGSLITLPTNIVKPSDANFTYEFVGWDNNIEIVDGNYDLNAVFEKREILKPKEEEEESNGFGIVKKVSVGLIGAVVAGIIASVIVVFKKQH